MSTTHAAVPALPRLSAAERVVRGVIRGLYNGQHQPGERLVEPELMATHEVSRSTVREALQRLAILGVVEQRLNRGATIRQLSATETGNILAIAEALVGLAARQAAAHIRAPGARTRLRRTLAELRRASAQAEEYPYVRARNHFHRLLADLGQNPLLADLLAGLQVHLIRRPHAAGRATRLASYEAIAAAVLAGDGAAAEQAARAHVRDAQASAPSVAQDTGQPLAASPGGTDLVE